MPFNPNEPQNGQKIDADVVRAQLNALKALNDDLVAVVASLNARIAALEPRVASGFDVPLANGKLRQVGDLNGQPLYQTDGGWYVGFMGTPAWWAIQPDDPRPAGFNGVYYRQDASLTGQYVNGNSNQPAGTVS